MNSKIKNKVAKAPQQPGVYFWLNQSGRVLYVGRAVNLRNRLKQYLAANLEPRIAEMVKQAADIKHVVAASLLEAIVLEAKNIKKYWPKYNVKDCDDRSFVYVFIPTGPFSKPTIIRGRELDKFSNRAGRIFGPYQSFQLINKALRLIRRVFPYGTCQPQSGRACFDYQIGLCPGACLGKISAREYQKNISNLQLLLAGDKKLLLNRLMKENPDKLTALQHLQDVSLLSKEDDPQEQKVGRLEAYDISHFQGKESYGAMAVFEDGQANPQEYRLFKIKTAPAGDDERALAEVLTRRFKHQDWLRPDIIIIDGGRPQISFLSRIIEAQDISIPLVGISKFGGDELVFPSKMPAASRSLISRQRATLLKLRDEAHRFANRGRKTRLRIR